MVGWHHQLNRHEFEETLGDGKGQESLACCSPQLQRGHDSGTKQEVMSNSFVIPWIVAHQTPLNMGFPRQDSPGKISH